MKSDSILNENVNNLNNIYNRKLSNIIEENINIKLNYKSNQKIKEIINNYLIIIKNNLNDILNNPEFQKKIK